jgi:hypothetical protein
MRVRHLAILAGLGLILAGCVPATTNSGAAKLPDGAVGTWTGNRGDVAYNYEFNKDSTFNFSVDKTKVTGGKWKVAGDKEIELTYNLSREQAEALQEDWKREQAIEGGLRKAPGVPERPKLPEPKEGENVAVRKVELLGNTLSLDTLVLRKAP